MAQLFAYIAHKQGALDDSAAELAVAAARLSADPVTAIVTGSGAELDTACQAAAAIYSAVWKFDNAALAYPNAEIIRKLLVNAVPAGSLVLIAHDTFGMDLGPGLSIKLDCAYAADVIGIDSARRCRRHFGAPGVCRNGPCPYALRYLQGRGAHHPPGLLSEP